MTKEQRETKRLREKYKAIVAWGKTLLSYDYYINNQVHEAEADGAPTDAIYKNQESGKWVTLDDCCEGTRHDILRIITSL